MTIDPKMNTLESEVLLFQNKELSMVLTSPCSENVRLAKYGAKMSFKDDRSLKRNMILVKSSVDTLTSVPQQASFSFSSYHCGLLTGLLFFHWT